MAHVSDFSQEEDKIILDLVNYDNGTNFTLAELQTASPVVQDGKVRVRITPVQGTGYGGFVNVEYKRINIGEFIELFRPDGLVVQQGNAENTVDFLDEINTLLGTSIKPSSVVSSPIGEWEGTPNEIKEVSFTMHANSKVYEGEAFLIVDGNDIPLASVVTKNVLSGLRLPSGVEPRDLKTDIDAFKHPFRADIGESKESILTRLSAKLGTEAAYLALGDEPLPSANNPGAIVTLRSLEAPITFGGEEQMELSLSSPRFVLANNRFTVYVPAAPNGNPWAFNATRGWFNNGLAMGVSSLSNLPSVVINHLKGIKGNFYLNAPVGRSQAFVELTMSSGNVPRLGLHDNFATQVQDQYVKYTTTQRAGLVNEGMSMTLTEEESSRVRAIRFYGGNNASGSTGERGIKDLEFDLFVTE